MQQCISQRRNLLVEEFCLRLNDYELEVGLMDIYCMGKYFTKGVECEKFFITPEYRDHGIDALAVFKDNLRKIYSVQISRGEKRRNQLLPFLTDTSIEKYTDIIKQPHVVHRVVITLKNSPKISDVDEWITGNEIKNMIARVFERWNMTPAKLEEYIENIQTRAFHWDLLNAHRKKHRIDIVNNYLGIMHCNYNCLLHSNFKMSAGLQTIVDFHSGEVLDYTKFNKKDQEKIKTMVKVKTVCDSGYETHLDSIEKLVVFLLEMIDYNLDKYDIVPCCTYISVKLRRPSKVIAYFAYKYEASNTNSYHFAFKCERKSLDGSLQLLHRVVDNNNKTLSDACSFKTPVLLTKPDLDKDKELIKILFQESEASLCD